MSGFESIGDLANGIVDRAREAMQREVDETDAATERLKLPASDAYAWWRKALAGNPPELTLHVAEPGFYRKSGRNGVFEPVAVWDEDGARVAMVGAKGRIVPADAAWCEKVFSWCCKHPVTEAAYRAVCRGEPWPDIDPVVHEQRGMGHNSGAAGDAEALRDQVTAALEGVKQYAEVADDETASRAQSLRARLLTLAGEVKTTHKVEKEPHLIAGREVDAKWLPLAKDAQAGADSIRAALSRYETDKVKKYHADVAAAAAKPAIIRSAYGRPASVRIVKRAVIVDQDAVYGNFKNTDDVKAALQRLAQKAVDAGMVVAGVNVEEQRDVR